MEPDDRNRDERLAALEAALHTESQQRKEALLWQEHRLLTALRNVFEHRRDAHLRWAAIGGLISAFLGRTATTAIVGGGIAGAVFATLLALQANYLLAAQNQKLDVQIIVTDSQRRTQAFQADLVDITAALRDTNLEPRDVTSRIVGLSLRMRPYPSLQVISGDGEALRGGADPVEGFTLLDVFRSPADLLRASRGPQVSLTPAISIERGQLLSVVVHNNRFNLSSLTRAGADFSGSDLSGRQFGPANISSTRLSNSSFRESTLYDVVALPLLPTPDWPQARTMLDGADFTCAAFSSVDLSGAVLRNARFNEAVTFGNLFLPLQALFEAEFTNARLNDVIFVSLGEGAQGTKPKDGILADLIRARISEPVTAVTALAMKEENLAWLSRARVNWFEDPGRGTTYPSANAPAISRPRYFGRITFTRSPDYHERRCSFTSSADVPR